MHGENGGKAALERTLFPLRVVSIQISNRKPHISLLAPGSRGWSLGWPLQLKIEGVILGSLKHQRVK